MAQMIAVPDELYERLRQQAAATHVAIEDVAARALVTGLPPSLDDVPAPHRAALRQLEALPDNELWAILKKGVPAERAARHAALLDLRARERLSARERAELRRLRAAADGLMLRRAHAAALLRWRGHTVPLPGG